MFFKKKKFMTDKTTNNTEMGNENADNMAQNQEIENLSDFINVDEIMEKGFPDENNNEEIEKLQGEIVELKDKHLRMVAEFDNFRRRNAKERMELVNTAGKDILQSLLVVLDDVDRASKQLETTTDIEVLKEGISLVFNKFRSIMLQKGLKVMEAKNQEFNPDLHEAITEIPAPSKNMVGKVIEVVEPGYYLNDKLIRHAKVVVGN
jgi:molecular chaperone GrpE